MTLAVCIAVCNSLDKFERVRRIMSFFVLLKKHAKFLKDNQFEKDEID